MIKRFFSLSLMIILAIGAWADEVTVSTEKTWTFRDYEDGDKTAFSEKDGLYSRAISARYYTISSLESPKLLSFSDGFVVNINKVAVTNSGSSYSTSGDNPAYITTANSRPNNTNNGTQLFAFNASVAGTVYVLMEAVATSSYRPRIYFYKSGDTGMQQVVNNSNTTDTEIHEFSYTSTEAGSFFIGSANQACKIYAIRFVPTGTSMEDKATLNLNTTTGGTVSVKVGDTETDYRTFDKNTNVTLTAAAANDYYAFTKWTIGESESTKNPLTLEMNADKTLTANYEVVNHTLSVSYDNTGGTVTMNGGTEALAADYNESVGEGSVTLTATPASGYQFVEWTDNDNHRLSTLNTYTFDLTADTQVKAVFKQPASPAPEITTATTWTFDAFTVGTKLSGTKVYEFDGLYISGHNSDESNQAQVLTITPAVTTTISGEVANRLRIAGKNNSIKNTTVVSDFNADAIAFMAGKPGVVTADVKGSSGNKYNIYVGGNLTQVDMTGSLQLLQQDILTASSVFISTNNGGHDVYAVKFTPEVVTAPVISVNESLGTITEGTSNLTETANKVIKTYYTIDGTEPTAESTLYEGVIMASGENITVKAISINTITGTKSEVTTATGLTLQLPVVTFSATATNGTVAWKKAGTTDAQANNYEKGTTIEVTAIPADGYMFQSWTKGDEVVAKTPTYTFTLTENTVLVAHFKSIGNTVPVILVAGQSNTDGRIDASELPASFTGLAHCLWSYANAKASPSGTFSNKVYEIGDFTAYTPTSDTGTQWAYDAVVYDQIGKQLGSNFYVIKQSKGNTGISPASGGCGLFWSANPLWMSRTTSANEGGQSLLKALCDHIDASLEKIPAGKTADIKFLLWHQGEGDGNGSQGAVYYTQLKAVINHVRNHLAAKNAKYSNLPFILGGITSSSAQYRAEVEAAKQQLATEDANIYYVSADEVDETGLKNDVLHFNAIGAQTLGNKVWQTIYENNLLLGLEDGTGSSTPVADILKESEPVTSTTKWDFSGKEDGTAYAEKTDINGLYLHGSSSNKMTVKATDVTSVTYYDGEEVTTSKAVRSASGDRSKFMTYGLTAGDVVAVDRMIGVNTGTEGTFYAVIAPETQPTIEQSAREIYLLFNGEKVATINALEAWNASDDHTVKLKYTADKAGTFFLTGQHPYLLYAAKFVKAGEETGGFTITAVAEGGTITMTAPEGKTLNSTFSKGEEVTLKATAEEGYEFVRWTDADNQSLGTSETLTITVDSDMTIHAVFKAKLKPVVFQFATAAGNSEVLSFDATAITLVENDGNKNSSRSDYYRMTNNSTELPSNGKLSWRVPAGKSNPTLESGGIKGNSYPLAIHNLSEGDEIALLYSGGTMKNYTPTTADAITANGVDVEAGETIASGQILSIKSVSAENNYIVLYLDNKTVISAIYINSELPEEYANNLYVSPNGNDNNTGKSKSSPFRTLKKAQEMVASGQTIHILPGTYQVTNDEYMDQTDNTWNIVYQLNKDNVQYIGEADADGKRPVFDFSGVTSVNNKRITGFHLAAANLVIKNIETIGIKAAPVSGTQSENFRLNGATDCQLINIAAHDGEGIGFYIHRTSAGNLIQDCDAYNNFDATNNEGGNNDGFGCHVSAGYEGNKFVNCRAWNNADDGFDLKSCYSKVVIEGCIAYKNGYDANGNKQADGNGFKVGGFGKQAITLPSGGSPMHEVNNSIAAENKAAGFYSNHHLGGLQFESNRAYHNGTDYRMTNRDMASVSQAIENATDPEMNVGGYGHILMNNLSYKSTTVISDIDVNQCTVADNSFTYDGGSWSNESYTDNDFESVDLDLLTKARDANGHLSSEVFSFMKLKEVGDVPAAPSYTESSKEIGKVTYTILYPEDAELHYILPDSEEMTTQEGTVVNGKKNYTIEVSVSGEMKLYSQKGKKASDIVKVNVVVPQPTAAVTLNFVQLYKKNKNFDLGMNDASKTTRYFCEKKDDAIADKNGNFYTIEASPVNGMISWREKAVAISASGLKPTNDSRPFAIHNLMEGDVIRIEFEGDIYYAKHSTKGDALKDIAPGDAIASMTAYTVSAIDEENGYVMFYPTKATTISQISINEELASTKASKPTISEPTENPDGTKSYTVTINKGETLHYTAPDKEEEQTVNYQETDEGSYVITVTQSGSLTCWTTLEGDTEKSAETKVLVTFAADEPTEKITVHTIGDSTMSSYDQNIPAQKGMDGWGSYLGDCLKSDWATVYNWADRGEGAKSYYNGIWLKTSTDRPEFGEPVMNKVKAGDYVIIQFGHNDSKAYSTEVYEEWMGKLVDAVKEKGATPIIASSICRRRFNADGTISLLGQINSIEDAAGRVPKEPVTGDEHEYDYPYHARMVAQAKGIEFIDVTAGTKALYERYGDEKSQAFFPYGEKTHTNQLGAQTIAKVVAQILFENNTALKKYVDIAQLELPDADTIEVVKIVDNFKDEATVTSKRTWTFNDYEAGTVIANQVTNLNGMYARGHAEATIDAINATPVTKVTFSDDNQTSVLVSRAAKAGANSSGANSIGLNTAGRADASALRNTFAFNIATPGTFYAAMAPQEEAAGKNMRLLFSGVEKVSIPVATAYANDNHLCELTFHAETTGVIYLCAGVASHLYAAMFVPDMEKGTEEDWNYQMVLTRANGWWTYTNLSGSNQSVPEGLTVYAVSAIDSEGNATLADIGHVIPQHQGFLVKGKANTEYALPATTEEETYKGSNLLVGNATLRFLPATEDGNTNYWFDGTKFVKATGNETIHEKQAYLSAGVAVDEVLLDMPDPVVENAVVTLKDDSRKDRKVYQAVFGQNQKFYYLRPGQDTEPRSQSYKAEFAENPFTVTVSHNGNFIYWLQETVNGHIYESRHDTIVVNSIAKKPTSALSRVEGEVAYYAVTFTAGTVLHYTLQDGLEAVMTTGSVAEVPVTTSYQMKAWSENEHVVSDVLTVTLFAPTPPPSEDGEVDFSEASEDLPSDLEVTLDMEQAVRVDGETLYKPSALTAATFNDRFAFSELTTSKKITITTKHQLTFAKGDDVKMAILGLSAGDIVAFDFTGSIQISDPTMLTLGQPNNSAPMRAADTAEEMMISEASYEVVRDGDVLLNVLLADESMKISRMYIAAKPSLSAPATIQFSEAAEEYEALEYGNVVNVYYKGKSSAQEFCRVTNNQGSLPISGKLSVEAAAGEIVTNGLRTNGSRIAVHNVARGDVIMVHYQTGAVTYAGHDEKGCRVRIGDHVLEAGDTIHSGDIIVVNQVDYLNNYVVLRLDSKAIVSGLFINSEGVESISIPTIVDKGKNTIQITGGKSSTGMNVTTIYTTDGTEPTEKNGTSADGCYETFEVKLLQGGMVTIKAVTVSETGIASPVATLIVNADHLVYGPSFLMDENGNMYDVYNAWGQKVNAVRRGQLYIVNGKKIVYK